LAQGFHAAIALTGGQVRVRPAVFISSILIVTLLTSGLAAQQLSKNERESAKLMLQTIASDVRKHYYDPKFHGLDWDAIVAEAGQKIDKSTTFGMAMLHIAAAVDALNDSHTRLIPPRTMINLAHGWVSNWRSRMLIESVRHDYGWEYEIVGDRCFVTHVRPGSDAQKKGLHVGDEILSINNYRPKRETIQRAEYVFNVLLPRMS
jgi:C-terminal processing protease CtpA/Prc